MLLLKIIFIYVFSCLSYSNSVILKLSNSTECAYEIKQFCNNLKLHSDFQLLKCLQKHDKINDKISDKCQHFIWNYKNQLITLPYFNYLSNGICDIDLGRLRRCKDDKNDETIICLLKHKLEIGSHQCQLVVNELASVVFSDLLVIKKFLTHCTDNINQLKCGRMVDNDKSEFSPENLKLRIITQTSTINCLIEKIDKVEPLCKKQILRLGEIQADDYRTNPYIYYECIEEREELCGDIAVGNGKVYECLMRNKFHARMSPECRTALTKKQQVEVHDYKARGSLMKKCRIDIPKFHCVQKSMKNNIIDLDAILLCLVEAQKENSLEPECKAEIMEIRKELVDDTEHLDPKLMSECKHEIEQHCSQVKLTNQTLISCLMDSSITEKMKQFHPSCRKYLRQFLKKINPTENIMKLDPIISRTCKAEINQYCSNSDNGHADDVYDCLLKLATTSNDLISFDDDGNDEAVIDDGIEENKQPKNQPKLSVKCKDNLLTLAFYVEEDYSLNNKLFRVCHRDAIKLCNAPSNSTEMKKGTFKPHAIIFCLIKRWSVNYRVNKGKRVSKHCSTEIRSIVKIEADNIRLNYEIYSNCITDVNKHCHNVKNKLACLQLRFNKLKATCKMAIKNFLAVDNEDYSLKKLISKSCGTAVKILCKNTNLKLVDGSRDYFSCLIENKYDSFVKDDCRTALDYYQILSLNNSQIDHRFMKKCYPEINHYCDKLSKKIESVSKRDVISCLTKHLTTQLLNKTTNFSKACVESLRFEYIKKSDDVQFDTKLKSQCDTDIKTRCKHVKSNEIIQCLNEYYGSLTNPCYNYMTKKSLLQALDNQFDLDLRRHCSQTILNFCNKEFQSDIFRCLHKHMHTDGFDEKCHKVIQTRLLNRIVNVRLNTHLMDQCRDSITNDCSSGQAYDLKDMHYHEKHRIIECLKNLFVTSRKFIKATCRRLILDLIIDGHMEYHLDPDLEENCHDVVKQHCEKQLMENNRHGAGQVQECLKRKFLDKEFNDKKCINQVWRLLNETKADVHVDFQLYSACKNEIHEICESEILGDGRKLSCLLWTNERKDIINHISQPCINVLNQRKEMWALAAKLEAPESVAEVFEIAVESKSRYYILTIVCITLLVVLILGICCGRMYCQRAAQLRRKRF